MVVLLLAALAVPALTGTALVLTGRDSMTSSEGNANLVSLVASAATAALVVATVITRPVVDYQWLPSLGVRWQFSVDGISAPLLVLTAALGLAVVVHARSYPPHGGSPTTFYGCLQLVEFGALATFLSRDAVVFFLSFEVVLIPMWVLISR
ncbi:MAG: complex I subunit 4 family protein, partial [Dermatophilaceae bacterium]